MKVGVFSLKDMEDHRDQIGDAEFLFISRFVYRNFGIVLGEEKRSLVVGRLRSCLQKRGVMSFADYLNLLKRDRTGEIHSELINQISTNFTSFFREASHFDYLAAKALPEIVQRLRRKGSNDLRIWCAACASGEEAYTIQMTVMKTLGLEYAAFNAGLLATDISAKVLEIARKGIYSKEQLSSLSYDMKKSYFNSYGDGQYIAKENLRNSILFRRFNLMNEKFPFTKPFQIIFARNVMIYFDEDTRRNLVKKLYDLLEPGGYIFIGHSETISQEWANLKSVIPAAYQKRS